MELIEARMRWKRLQAEWSVANKKALEAEQRADALAAAAVRRGLAPSERDKAAARAHRAVADKYQIEMKKFVVQHLGS